MARRLLGADNAATVLNTQDAEEEPVTQVRWLCGPTHLEGEPLTQTHSPETTQAGVGTSERRVHTSSVFDSNPTVACLCDNERISFRSHDYWSFFISC